MANTNKKTINTHFEETIAILEKCDFLTAEEKSEKIEFYKKRIELNAKKNSGTNGDKKPTAIQIENMGIKAQILLNMQPNIEYTITNMIKQFDCCAELSNQKISNLANQLVNEGKLSKIKKQGNSLFVKIVEDTEVEGE